MLRPNKNTSSVVRPSMAILIVIYIGGGKLEWPVKYLSKLFSIYMGFCTYIFSALLESVHSTFILLICSGENERNRDYASVFSVFLCKLFMDQIDSNQLCSSSSFYP